MLWRTILCKIGMFQDIMGLNRWGSAGGGQQRMAMRSAADEGFHAGRGEAGCERLFRPRPPFPPWRRAHNQRRKVLAQREIEELKVSRSRSHQHTTSPLPVVCYGPTRKQPHPPTALQHVPCVSRRSRYESSMRARALCGEVMTGEMLAHGVWCRWGSG